MSEKLIPFCFETARKHPERVRYKNGDAPKEVMFSATGSIVCFWKDYPNSYSVHMPDQYQFLKLAAPVREERFVACQYEGTGYIVVCLPRDAEKYTNRHRLPASALSIDQTTGEIVVRVDE